MWNHFTKEIRKCVQLIFHSGKWKHENKHWLSAETADVGVNHSHISMLFSFRIMYWAVYIAYDSCSNLFNSNSHELCHSSAIQCSGIILMVQNGSFLLYKWLLCALDQAAVKRADEKSNISSSSSPSLPQKEREGEGEREEEGEGDMVLNKAVAFKTCTCNSGHIFYPLDLQQK